MNSDDWKSITVIIGVICLTIYGIVALLHNINSAVTAAVVGAIVSVIGFLFGFVVGKKQSANAT